VRERKRMRSKISAMSMEALASAAIIAVVPFVVTFALYMTSPAIWASCSPPATAASSR
jgi:tight adherence protein B